MKKIEANQENLADINMKAKKEWKKPELKILDIRNTKFNPGPYDDGSGIGTTAQVS